MATKSIPKRFKDPYREGGDRMMKVLGQFMISGDATPTQAEVDRMAGALTEGDPLADAVIDWFEKVGHAEGRRLLDQALDEGIASVDKAPKALRNFFAQVDQVPEWVDWDIVEFAARTSMRSGMAGELVLSCVALMGGYRSGGGNKPIAFTGALEYDAARRLVETSSFVHDASQPGGLHRFSQGFKSTIRVRIMHALVRRMCAKSPNWKQDDWGLPVNQADLVGTHLLFSVVFLSGLQVLGFRFSRKEEQAVMHFWRYIGFLMGISEDLIPRSKGEGMRQAYLIGMTQPPADEDSYQLGQALMKVPMLRAKTPVQKVFGWLEMQYRSGLSRIILGDKAADGLGLPDNILKYSVFLTTPAMFLYETLRQRIPALNELAIDFGRRQVDAHMKKLLQNNPADFKPVKQLAKDAVHN